MTDENMFLLYAACMGVFITFIYDIIRIFRRVIPHNVFWVSVEDLGFWAYCAVEVFLLLYHESNGTLRWFAILGALAGMFFYKKTAGGIFVTYSSFVLGKFLYYVGKPFRKLGAVMGNTAGRIGRRKKHFGSFVKKKLTEFRKMFKMILCKR